jgi:hypothetical protein
MPACMVVEDKHRGASGAGGSDITGHDGDIVVEGVGIGRTLSQLIIFAVIGKPHGAEILLKFKSTLIHPFIILRPTLLGLGYIRKLIVSLLVGEGDMTEIIGLKSRDLLRFCDHSLVEVVTLFRRGSVETVYFRPVN